MLRQVSEGSASPCPYSASGVLNHSLLQRCCLRRALRLSFDSSIGVSVRRRYLGGEGQRFYDESLQDDTKDKQLAYDLEKCDPRRDWVGFRKVRARCILHMRRVH